MTKTGRPTIFTKAVADEICEHRRKGLPLETSCELAGVSPRAVYAWRKCGDDCLIRYEDDLEKALKDPEDGWSVEFARDIARASAEGEQLLLERVSKAGKGGWAAGWILERVHRRRYSTRSEQAVEVEGRMDLGRAMRDMSEEELKRLAAVTGTEGAPEVKSGGSA